MTQDLRLAVRALWRTPGFADVATLVFALASGAVIASLALIHAVLIRPLPVRDQGRLVIAWKEDFKAGFAHFPFSHPSTKEIRRHLTTTSAIATIDYNGAWPLSTVDGDAAFKLPTGQVSGDFFQVLGVEPVVGRLFRPEDDVIGGPHLIAIGEKLWRSRYGADSSVIGRRIEIFGVAHEIVGVVPGDFEYPRGAVAWMPMYPWHGAWLDGLSRPVAGHLGEAEAEASEAASRLNGMALGGTLPVPRQTPGCPSRPNGTLVGGYPSRAPAKVSTPKLLP